MGQISYGTITITDTTDIERIYIEYCRSTSNQLDTSVTPPVVPNITVNWSENTPEWVNNQYIWQRSVIEKAGVNPIYGNPICVTGAEGSIGRGIDSVATYYCVYGEGTPTADEVEQIAMGYKPTSDSQVEDKTYFRRNAGTYELIQNTHEENPFEEGWAELVLTTDTTVNSDKFYFEANSTTNIVNPQGDPQDQSWYELELTQDTEIQLNKNYFLYVPVTYTIVESPSGSPVGQSFFEIAYLTNSIWQIDIPDYDANKPNYWVKNVTTYTDFEVYILIYKDINITETINSLVEAQTNIAENSDELDRLSEYTTQLNENTNNLQQQVDKGLNEIEQSIGYKNWIEDNGRFERTNDTNLTINFNKNYYEKNTNYYVLTQDYEIQVGKIYYEFDSNNNTYSVVDNPSIDNLSTYYEQKDRYRLIDSYYDYTPTDDVHVDDTTDYYIFENEIYTLVINPIDADINTYYERSIINPYIKGYYELANVPSVSDYMETHFDNIPNGGFGITRGEPYPRIVLDESGMRIYDKDRKLVSTFGENITFSADRPQLIGNQRSGSEFTGIQFIPGSNGESDSLIISASNINIGGVTVANTKDVTNDINEAKTDINRNISNLQRQINTNKETLNDYEGFIDLNPTVGYIRIGKKEEEDGKLKPALSYLHVGVDTTDNNKLKVAINIDDKRVTFMDEERLYARSSVITNLYMQRENSEGNYIGAIGWVMRTNGHLSLKRIR